MIKILTIGALFGLVVAVASNMIAGSLAGIPGMILGIPAYTVLRVIASEFLSEFKVIQSLTKRMDNPN